MKYFLTLCFSLSSFLPISGAESRSPDQVLERIAFGSCYRPQRNPKIWESIAQTQPDLFLFLGDNIYADTTNPKVFRERYNALLNEAEFVSFRKSTPLLATWDDHDYGANDAGAEYPAKDLAKQEFLRAFPLPDSHPIHQREGIYHSASFGSEGKQVQVILLDTRWFRSELKRGNSKYGKACLPNTASGAGILGAVQWQWLQEQLEETADLRLICSSIQVLAAEHRFEKWANFPADLEKLEQLLSPKLREQTLILSGDRHMGEIMRHKGLTEVTSSGLTNAGGGNKKEANKRRIGQRVGRRNFGLIEIDWTGEKPSATLTLRGEDGSVFESQSWPK